RTISGASGNGFAIWAGPPDYAAAIASDVNARNLQIVNNPGAHQSAGIDVFIDNYLPQNFLANFLVENRLLYLGPEYAGETILVSLFDSDSGSQPPITFTFDSLAGTDWSLTFGIPGVDDPDGVPAGVRCTPGGCNNLWITPTYAITLPGDMSSCDWLNPDPTVCTPFYGGRFLGSYLDNSLLYASDTFGWQVTVPPPSAVDPLQGCSAFPIAIHDDVHSVTAVNGTNPYPDAADFAYPLAPPTYDSFVGNTPDIPLILAEEGDVFKLVGPGFSAGNYGWLLWNAGKPADANTLAASLTWPGDSLDYADHGDTGAPVGDFAHVVRGYVNSINDADVTLNLNNPVGASAANLGSAAAQTAVNSHIDANRYLRLPLWDTAVPANNQYLISGFAIFRIIGYGATAGEDWLLLEFVRRDASCGQLEAVALESVAISGPTTGPVNATASFTATVNPISTTLPLTYTWEATGQTAVARAAASLADIVSFTWPVSGTQTITVSVSNAVGGPIIETHTFTVEMQTLYLPLMLQNWEAPAAWLEKP
ncbi:MAG: hypothetical protein GY803_20040, partial [Chloroflexi bacterium]|nr:hypothetical protein [Chloroflexota bacterium]